ncbi:MAG: GNAT family N-acetyltransferase [Clostridiales bacterium]|nr:GNAT family N-acetyltransferase [Clostridiales bacterium]
MIRILTITDYEEIYDLWTKTDGMGLRSLDDSKEGISSFLKRNPNTNFVWELNGEIVGVILSGHDGRRGYIYHMVVDCEYRNNGIGQQMVDKVIEALDEEGIKKVALVVFKNNTLGNKFWSSIGFEKRDDLIYRNKTIDRLNI